MAFREIVDSIVRRQAEGIVAVPVRGVDTGVVRQAAFVPGEVYLEVRLRQMWLTHARELWREYLPFGIVVTEFIHKGQRVSVPTVMSSAELSRRLQVTEADDAVEINDMRVAGPVPYEGDDVSLLVALFRAKTTDWIARSLKVVEDVTTAVGFGGLAGAIPLANSLIRGIESFLESADIELRVGAYRSWQNPTSNGGGLRPMHYCVMRRPRTSTSAAELDRLRVVDGRLHQLLDDGVTLAPYTAHDFILISVEATHTRDDYRQLEFYPLWEKTKDLVINGDLASAQRSWRKTAGAIFTDDLTRPQQEALFAEYQRLFGDLVERFSDPTMSEFRTETTAAWVFEDDPATILAALGTSPS